MEKKWVFSIALLAAGAFLVAMQACGDGILIVEPPRKTKAPVPLSVKYHRVRVRIQNQVAETTVDQVFRNSFDTDLEATYLFPLPEKASISSFSMFVNGKRMSGEILDKEKARQIYEEIVRKMRDPGLLEYAGRNLFRARVYPVPAHGETRIELVYTEALLSDGGVFQYVYPLDTERFSPDPIEEVAISAHIKSDVPIKSVYSPSHDVDVGLSAYEAQAGFEARHVKPDRDFILYYTVSEGSLGMNLLTYRARGEDGYFLLLLSPGQIAGSRSKDVVFIIDTSGSMREGKMGQAKRAIDFCLDNLKKDDRFNIVQFATSVRSFRTRLVSADEGSVGSAHDFVDTLEARGGTNIDEALRMGISMFGDTARPRMLVFLTDGEPTVGTTDESEILKNVKRVNRAGARMFVFGVGNDVNTHLLDRLAEMNRGVSDYVRPSEDLEMRITSFFRKVSEPVLGDISLRFEKAETSDPKFNDPRVYDLYPNTIPDLFRGAQILILGRYSGEGSVTVTLTGKSDGREERIAFRSELHRVNGEHGFIPRLWATRKIGYLVDQIRLHGETQELDEQELDEQELDEQELDEQELDEQELIDEIVSLSKEHGIMTPYTSFLILEEDASRDETSFERWGIKPEAASSVKEAGKKYAESMEAKKGESAVSRAKDIRSLKTRSTEERPSMETVKYLGRKTFYLRHGIWVDSEYREGMKTVEVPYLSQAYFDLLRERPELGRYFSIAPQLIVVFDSNCYKTTEGTP